MNPESVLILVRYVAENLALFCGGLFSGAAIYICLTEQPPRTMLTFADLLALARSNGMRSCALLGALATLTALAAFLAWVVGAGPSWLIGAAAQFVALVLVVLISRGTREIIELPGEPDFESHGRALLGRQSVYLSGLALLGLLAQYLFIVKL